MNQESVVLPKTSKSVPVIMLAMLICSCLVLLFAIIGVYQSFFGVPGKKAEIKELQTISNIWQDRAVKAEAKIEEYKVAMNLEKLFLLVAKPDTITLLGELEEELCNKAQFCLGKNIDWDDK